MTHKTIVIDNQIVLRQLQPSDSERLFNLLNDNRKHLGRWLDWVEQTNSPADTAKFIKSTLEQRKNGETLGYGILVNSKLAGHMSLMHIKDQKEPEIGYWLDRQYTRQGIMTKAVIALTQFGLETLKLPKIIIMAHPDNIASNKVAEKCGYKLDGQKQT